MSRLATWRAFALRPSNGAAAGHARCGRFARPLLRTSSGGARCGKTGGRGASSTFFGAMAVDEQKFLEFHALASQRKLDLAMRGLDVPNFSIDDLFEEAERRSLPNVAWNSFLREKLPSPRDDLEERAASEAAEDAHSLRHIANLLSVCCHGDEDVDLDALLRMGAAFVRLLEGVGTFAALTVQEVSGNLTKIRRGCAAVGMRGGSMLGALRAESQAGLHGPGGLLQDPSAAMGVLWIARFLAFWEEVRAELAAQDMRHAPVHLHAWAASRM